MWKNLPRRWEKRRARISRSRRQHIRRCLDWRGRTKLPTSFRRRPSPTWRLTANAQPGCAGSRNSWFTAAPDPAVFFLPMTTAKNRTRLDVLIFERGLAPSREKAQAMILAGEVVVNGAIAAKAGQGVARDAAVEIHSRIQKYVSRGGFKLEGALRDFAVDASGRICLDLGSSNGGF